MQTKLLKAATKRVALLLIIASGALIQGCGFHVRTAELDSLGFNSVNFECDQAEHWQLCQSLERELRAHKVTMDEDAAFMLSIDSASSTERAFTINLDASADEYEITRLVKFTFSEANNTKSKYSNEINARRIYRHHSDALLAKEREKTTLTKALDKSIAREIIRQLTLIRIGANDAG